MPFYEYKIQMPEPFQELYDSLVGQLEHSQKDQLNIIIHCQQSISTIKASIDLLKKYVSTNSFNNKEEEILFFKFIKPKFYSKLIYYLKVFKIESRRPIGSDVTEKIYLMRGLDKLSLFFETNLSFYEYYRTGATFMDEKYFLRGSKETSPILDSMCLDADPNFATRYDYKVAKIIANDMLRDYLNKEIEKQNIKHTEQTPEHSKNLLKWTDSKTALIELSYALKYAGSFNNGHATVKQITECFEKTFDVELGNTSKALQEILSRKSGYTNFLHKLDTKLVQYIESII